VSSNFDSSTPLAYTGINTQAQPKTVAVARAPMPTDWQSFYPGDLWRDISVNPPVTYILESVAGNVAIWERLGCCTSMGLISLTGTDGIPVYGDTFENVNFAGTNITAIGTASTITFTASNVLNWYSINSNTNLAINSGYFCIGGSNLQLYLPGSSILGDTIEITLDGASSFTIVQAAGQQIRYGNEITTLGIGGTLSSTAQGDAITLKCTATNTKWSVISSIGNLDVT